ncbi:MAG: hypothetical protein DRI57_03035 [Deltaproteobacteria bacterium]|nr:MAG: hypothetical protein DRI57_03035 [Deltaproteobacteria bacterium]
MGAILEQLFHSPRLARKLNSSTESTVRSSAFRRSDELRVVGAPPKGGTTNWEIPDKDYVKISMYL